MSHHDGQNDIEMNFVREMFLKEEIGPTGEFPEGKLTPMDQGEIRIAIGVEKNKVVMHFGKEVAWIGFNRKQAIQIAGLLIDHAAHCSE